MRRGNSYKFKLLGGGLLSIILIFSMNIKNVFAEKIEETIDGTKYTYDTDTKTLTCSGTSVTDAWKTNNKLKAYINVIEHVIIGKKCSSIGNYSFANCSALKGVTIKDVEEESPSSLSIGDRAFYNCTNLTYFRSNNSTQTSEVNLKSRITSIGNYTFANCRSITELHFSSSVRSIGDYAFIGCSGLCYDNRGAYASIVYDEEANTIDSTTFNNGNSSVQYPMKCVKDGKGTIGVGAFKFYSSLNAETLNVIEPTVSVSQSVSWYNRNEGIAKVTLSTSATTGSYTTAKDYIVIVDTSNSMNEAITIDGVETNLMEVAKSSVSKFITAVANENSENRIAIISMGAYDEVVTVFWTKCDTSGVNKLQTMVSAMDYSSKNRNLGESANSSGTKYDNTKGIYYGNGKRPFARTDFSNALITAMRLICIKGNSNPVYGMFFSDGEPTDKSNGHITTDLKSAASAYCSMLEQSHVFFMGNMDNTIMQECGEAMASEPDFWTIYPRDDKLQQAIDGAVNGIFEWSKITVLDSVLSEIYNSSYWEVYSSSGFTVDTENSKVSTDLNGVGQSIVTKTFYLKLKDRNTTLTSIPVSNNVSISYKLSRGTSILTVQNNRSHSLDWFIPYNIVYDKGLTNN